MTSRLIVMLALLPLGGCTSEDTGLLTGPRSKIPGPPAQVSVWEGSNGYLEYYYGDTILFKAALRDAAGNLILGLPDRWTVPRGAVEVLPSGRFIVKEPELTELEVHAHFGALSASTTTYAGTWRLGTMTDTITGLPATFASTRARGATLNLICVAGELKVRIRGLITLTGEPIAVRYMVGDQPEITEFWNSPRFSELEYPGDGRELTERIVDTEIRFETEYGINQPRTFKTSGLRLIMRRALGACY